MEKLKKKSPEMLEKASMQAIRWIGSVDSLLIHTLFFVVSFALYFWGVPMDRILLIVTTLVSLEAIYLSIFMQISINRQTRRLREVARDVEEIQEDVEEIEKDVDEIQKDVEEIQEDVEEIEKDDALEQKEDEVTLSHIQETLRVLMQEVTELKKQHEKKTPH